MGGDTQDRNDREVASTSAEPGRGSDNLMYRDLRLDRQPSRKAEAKVKHGAKVRIGSLNLRSLIKPTMPRQLEAYMEERGVGLVCLQDTKVAQTTQYVVGDLLYIVHGHERPEQEYSGVGFIGATGLRTCIVGVELGRDDRIIALGLDLAPRHLTVITAHAPHSRRPEDGRKTFFSKNSRPWLGFLQKMGQSL